MRVSKQQLEVLYAIWLVAGDGWARRGQAYRSTTMGSNHFADVEERMIRSELIEKRAAERAGSQVRYELRLTELGRAAIAASDAHGGGDPLHHPPD